MSDTVTPDWNAKILKALKENSRRFAKTAKAKGPPKSQAGRTKPSLRSAKARGR